MEKRKPKMDPANYLSVLRSQTAQLALSKQLIDTQFIASCIEAGVVVCRDKTLLSEIERSVGRTIVPDIAPDLDIAEEVRNSAGKGQTKRVSTAGMPVVSSGTPLFAQPMPAPEDAMYRQAVAETDARIAASPILQHKSMEASIEYNARKDWCTPELMKALVVDPTFVYRLRCAMYPYLVSYTERTFPVGDKTYLVPYITICKDSKNDGTTAITKDKFFYGEDGKGVYNKYDNGEGYEMQTTTFYLNNKGKIGVMTGVVKHMYDPTDFASPEAVRRYMAQLKEAYNSMIKSWHAPDAKKQGKKDWKDIESFLGPYASGKKPIDSPKRLMYDFMRFHRLMVGGDTGDTFLNIKTGQSFWSVTRNNRKEVRMDGNGWQTVIDVTDCTQNGWFMKDLVQPMFTKKDPDGVERIKAEGLKSLMRLHEKMLSTDKCVQTKYGGYIDIEGQDEFFERDFSA